MSAQNLRPLTSFHGRTTLSVGLLEDAPAQGTKWNTIDHPIYGFKVPDIPGLKLLAVNEGAITVALNVPNEKVKCHQLPGTLMVIPNIDEAQATLSFTGLTPVLMKISDLMNFFAVSVAASGGDFVVERTFDPDVQAPDLAIYLCGQINGKEAGKFFPKCYLDGEDSEEINANQLIKPGASIACDLEAYKPDGTLMRYYDFEFRGADPRTQV